MHASCPASNAHDDGTAHGERFVLIARVAAIMAAAPALDALLERTADAIHSILRYANVDIPVIEPDDPGYLRIRARGGDYKRLIRHEDRLPLGTGIMGAAAAERRTQLVNDVAVDARYVTPPGVAPPQAELAIPIIYGGDVLGVLNVEGPRRFDALDVMSLEIVAENLAVAIVNARLQEQARALALSVERQRLAHELHDNVTQILSSISLLTQSLPEAYARDAAEGERRAHRLGELAQLGIVEMRTLLAELAPKRDAPRAPARRATLHDAIRRLVGAMIPPHVTLHVDAAELPPELRAHELAVLRICQEAVSNAVRHARARRIEVLACATQRAFHFSVSDDGIGMPDASPPGMGLASMRQRAADAGGELRIRARRGGGTRIEAVLPRGPRT